MNVPALTAQAQPLIDLVTNFFNSLLSIAMKIGGMIVPSNPMLGAFMIFLAGIFLLKNKGEGVWQWVIIGVVVAFFLLK